MKHKLFLFLILLNINLCLLFSREKESVAILPFKSACHQKQITQMVTDIIISHFVKLDIFQVIERNQLELILNELKLTKTDDFSQDEVNKIGHLLKADIIVTGSVTALYDYYMVNLRGIDVITGQVLFADSQRINLDKKMNNKLEKLVKNVVDLYLVLY